MGGLERKRTTASSCGRFLRSLLRGFTRTVSGWWKGGFGGFGGDDERFEIFEGDSRGSATRADIVDLDLVDGSEGAEGGEVSCAAFVGSQRPGVGKWRDIGRDFCAECF